MPRLRRYVRIEEPLQQTVLVGCKTIDECLEVVDREVHQAVPGSRVTIFEKRGGGRERSLAMWRVHGSGPRRYPV